MHTLKHWPVVICTSKLSAQPLAWLRGSSQISLSPWGWSLEAAGQPSPLRRLFRHKNNLWITCMRSFIKLYRKIRSLPTGEFYVRESRVWWSISLPSGSLFALWVLPLCRKGWSRIAGRQSCQGSYLLCPGSRHSVAGGSLLGKGCQHLPWALRWRNVLGFEPGWAEPRGHRAVWQVRFSLGSRGTLRCLLSLWLLA